MLTTLVLWLLVVAVAIFIIYSHYVEPRRLGVTRRTVGVQRLPRELEGLKILHLADLHVKSEQQPFTHEITRRAVQLAQTEDADLICLTGDLAQMSPHVPLAAALLKPLTNRPMFAVMGNHDHDKMLESEVLGPPEGRLSTGEWRRTVEAAGIQVLHNQHIELLVRGRKVIIAGAGDPSCGFDDLPRTLAGNPQGDLHLLLVHSPDMMDHPLTDWADLVLCGHTHGGQAKLPGIGTIWAPVWRDRRRAEGLFRVGHTLCCVTRGVAAGIRTRFLCPPELGQLTLTSAAGDPVRELPRYECAIGAWSSTSSGPIAFENEQQEA